MSHAQDKFVNRMFSVLLLGMGLTVSAGAQTAHFSYAQVTVGGGFNNPAGVVVDGNGNVFVADTGNNAVKEIPSGCVTSSCVLTLGGGFNRPQGVAVDGSGDVFVADTGNNAVKEIMAASGYRVVNYLGGGSGFRTPTAVAVDNSGNVLVADSGDNAVVEIFAAEYYLMVRTLGSGFSYPDGIAVDGSGNVFVADQGHNAVKEILPAGGYTTVNTLASGINTPLCIAVDRNGNVFVAADGEIGVDEILAASGYSTIVKLGKGFNKSLGIAVDGSGNVFVADLDNSRVLKLQTAAVDFSTVAIGQTGAAIPLTFTIDSGGSIGSPVALTLGAEGLDFADAGTGTCTSYGSSHVYAAGDTCTVNVTLAPRFAGQRNGAVRLRDNSGNTIAMAYLHGAGSGPQVSFLPSSQSTVGGGFLSPFGVAVDGSGNIFVADSESNTVNEIPPGCAAASCIKTLGGGFNFPSSVAVDGSGNVFVADMNNSAVKEILAASGYTTVNTLGSGFYQPYGIAVDGNGNVFVADSHNYAVKEILAASGYTTVNTLVSRSYLPMAVAVDGRGDVFFTDLLNNAVNEIPVASGSAQVKTLGSGFIQPEGIAVDGIGNVFVSDSGNAVTELLVADGYTTENSLGSGFNYPRGVTVDGSGNVFVADFLNHQVVKLDYSDPPSLSFPTPTPFGLTDTTDGPQIATIQNTGDAPLTFQPFVVGNLLDAVLASPGTTSCTELIGLQLDVRNTCTLGFEFEPAQTGLVNGHVKVVDNAFSPSSSAYATQTIAFQGTGTAAQQTIGFMPPSQIMYTPLPLAVTLNATGGASGNPVTFTVVSGPGTINGIMLAVTGVGTVVIEADQAGNANYAPAPAVRKSVVVIPAQQTISFVPPNPLASYGVPPIKLSATGGGSGNPVTFTVASGPGKISGIMLTVTGVGHIVVEANQAGNADYTAAFPVSYSITVDQAQQTINFPNPSPLTYGVSPIKLSATGGSSRNPVTFTIVSGPGAISGNTLKVTGAGTIEIDANQAGNADYKAAPQVRLGITVHKAAQSINFPKLSSVIYGVSPIALQATGGPSGNPVTFTVVSGPGTISGNTLKVTGAGKIAIDANQAGNANYAAAIVQQEISVLPAVLTVTAINHRWVYGAAKPDLSYTITGFVNGDANSVSGQVYLTTTATAKSHPGVYPITFSTKEAKQSNYRFNYVNGSLIVQKAVLIVTANDASRVYGAPNPVFTYTIAGYVNGDTSNTVSGIAKLSAKASAASAVGTYPIMFYQEGLTASNYSFKYVNGTLTISPAK